jgi:hypothetical protein
MKKTIKIEFKNQTTKTFEVLSLSIDATNVVLRNHLDSNQPLFIEVGHNLLNTQLDFSQIKSFTALYFNDKNWFSGASLTDSNAKGDFSIISQSKKVLLFFEAINFELGNVYKIII